MTTSIQLDNILSKGLYTNDFLEHKVVILYYLALTFLLEQQKDAFGAKIFYLRAHLQIYFNTK